MTKDLFSMALKREIAFKAANRSEFVNGMMESGYVLRLSPGKSNLWFERKVQTNSTVTQLIFKKLNPLGQIFATFYPQKIILKVYSIKIIGCLLLLNAMLAYLLYAIGMNAHGIWFLAFLFFCFELLMVFFTIHINLDSILSKLTAAESSLESDQIGDSNTQ